MRLEESLDGNHRSDGTRVKGVLNVDFDETLTAEPPRDWTPGAEWPAPDEEMIRAVTRAWKDGHTIIVWSARRWVEAPYMVAWLTWHQVPFHAIRLEKGASDGYVDDKAIPIGSFLDRYGDDARAA